GGKPAYLAIVELDHVRAFGQVDHQRWIDKWRTQIDIEEFQRPADSKKPIQLFNVVGRSAGERTKRQRASLGNGSEGFRRNLDFVPGRGLNELISRVAFFIQGCNHGSGWKADPHPADKVDVDTLVPRNLQ